MTLVVGFVLGALAGWFVARARRRHGLPFHPRCR